MADSSDDESSSSASIEEGQEESPSGKRKANSQTQDAPSKKPKSGPASAPPLELAPAIASSTPSSNSSKPKPIIVLLDQARLETIKNRRGIFELLNCDDHRELCKRKLKLNPNDYRPDICHQEILALLDSPLNKAGLLKVYIKTSKNVLIDVHPSVRIPRTFKRFSGLMVQLLHKMKIKASSESTTLLKVIKNPFSQHLPAGTRVYGFSCQGNLYSPVKLAQAILPATAEQTGAAPICLVLGAMSSGHISMEDHPYIQEMISVSEYPLSGAAALSRLMGAFEHHWGIF